MNGLCSSVERGAAPLHKHTATCARCSASTSGRPFGSLPIHERSLPNSWRPSENIFHALPSAATPALRVSRLEAVRGGKQERTKKSTEEPTARHFKGCAACEQSPYLTIASAADKSRRAEYHVSIGWLFRRSGQRLALWGKHALAVIVRVLCILLTVVPMCVYTGCKQNGTRSNHLYQMQRLWHMCLCKLQGKHLCTPCS